MSFEQVKKQDALEYNAAEHRALEQVNEEMLSELTKLHAENEEVRSKAYNKITPMPTRPLLLLACAPC